MKIASRGNPKQPSRWRGRLKQILLIPGGCEARKIAVVGGVFFLTSSLIEHSSALGDGTLCQAEPLVTSGPNPALKNSPHADREDRARALVAAWGGTVKDFVFAHYAEIIQVREDFLNKAKSKTICGCKTWEEYVTQKLNCSRQQMRSLLAGSNPATAIHDGTANRQPNLETETTATRVPSPNPTTQLPCAPQPEAPNPVEEQTGEMTREEYMEGLVEAELERIAPAVSRKVNTANIPAKFFVYGSGGMDKRNGQAFREEVELQIKESLPDVYKTIIQVAQRLLAALPVMPSRVLTCPKCGNQEAGTFKSLDAPNSGSHRYHCQKCDHKASTRKFKYLPPMQPTIVETAAQPEPTNPKPRARKKNETSPAGMVNVDELPPEARARVMAQIEPTVAN